MSGGFWAGSVPPWGIVACSAVCVLFLLAGIWVGQGRRDRAYEDGYDDAMADERDRATIPAYRQYRAIENYSTYAHAAFAGAINPPEVAHEWEPVHVGQALAVASDPITTGEIRAITEGMDVFMARLLGEHPVPWPDGGSNDV